MLFPTVSLHWYEITRTQLTPVRMCPNVYHTCTLKSRRQENQDGVTTRLMKGCRKCRIGWLQATTVLPVYAVDYIQPPHHHHKLTCIPCMWWCPHTRNRPTSAINQLASKRHSYYDKAEGVASKTFTHAVNNLKIIKMGKKLV